MPTTDYVRYILSLLFVLGLVAGLGQLAKKYNWSQMGLKLAARNNKRLRILEIQAIDTRHRLVIARRDDTDYMLAVGPERVTLLDKLPARPDDTLPVADTSMGHPS